VDAPLSSPAQIRNHRSRAALTLVFCALCWSSAGIISRHLQVAAGLEITFWRSAFCLLFVGLALAVRDPDGWWRPFLRGGKVLWLSGTCWAVMFTCFMIALMRTTVANTLVVLAMAPLISALMARIILSEPLSSSTWAAIGAAFGGIVWMVHDQIGTAHASTAALSGMAIAAGVPLAASVNVITLKKWGTQVDLVPAIAIGALLSCICTLPLAWPLEASASDLTLLAVLGVAQLGLPCMLMVGASRHLAPQEITLLALLEVLFGPLWVWLEAGERPSDASLQGGLVVLVALVGNALWTSYKSNTSTSAPSPSVNVTTDSSTSLSASPAPRR
jgi:drug/metabolite transporter (DMT)-like permease